MKKTLSENRILGNFAKALALIALSMLLLVLFACKKGGKAQEYFNEALEHYNKFEMNEAKLLFTKSALEDAEPYLASIKQHEDYYLRAVEAFDKGDFATAEPLFTGIKQYLNSAEYLDSITEKKAEYEGAVELYKNGEYLNALAAFTRALPYAHSGEYIENIEKMYALYMDAFEYVALGDYKNAIIALKAINTDFENSAELIAELEKRADSQPITLGAFIMRYNDEFNDGTKIVAGKTDDLFYMVDTNGAWISGAMDERGAIRYISIYLDKKTRTALAAEGERLTLASFIHAIAPDCSDKDTVLADLPAYLRESGLKYACMHISGGENEYGGIVARAEYRP